MILSVSHLSKSFKGKKAVADVSLAIENGKAVGLLGPEWSGKDHDLLHDGWLGSA